MAHSTACRERIAQLIEEDDESRVMQYFERVKNSEERKKRKASEAAEASEQSHPGVREQVERPSSEVGSPKREATMEPGAGDASPSKRLKQELRERREKRKAGETPPEEASRGDDGGAVPSSSSGAQSSQIVSSVPVTTEDVVVPQVEAAEETEVLRSEAAQEVGASSLEQKVRDMLSEWKMELTSLEEAHVDMCFRKHEVESGGDCRGSEEDRRDGGGTWLKPCGRNFLSNEVHSRSITPWT